MRLFYLAGRVYTRRIVLSVIVGSLYFLLIHSQVYATTLTVDKSGDTVDGDYSAGNLTLREAISLAFPGDTIYFDSSVTFISLTSGELLVDKALTIAGGGNVTIDAGGASRIFNLDDGIAALVDISLSGLALTGGSAVDGGAIYNLENLSITGLTIDSNTATNGGGGIYNGSSAVCTITASVISGNSAKYGGGVYNYNYTNCTISTTTLEANSASSYGGGIYNTSATCSIDSSTLSSNTAYRAGGSYNISSTLNVSNSTISSNSAFEHGGAIYSEHSPSNISNSTIASNAASAGSAAVLNRYSASVCTLVSSIAANNHPVDISNIEGGSATGDYSLIEDPNGHSVTDGGTNIVGQDPMLGPLRNYGGPAETHVLMAGSPAIDVGFDPGGLTYDQRGAGYPRVAGSGIDMGSVEGTHTGVFGTLTVDNSGDTVDGDYSAGNLTLREAISLALPGDTIDFDPSVTSISLTSGELLIDKALTIAGGGNVTIDAGGASRIFNLDDGIASLVDISLSGLVLTSGNAVDGGAIYNLENLSVTGLTIDSNTATNAGGGIYNGSRAVCTITASVISGNSAKYGGGVYNYNYTNCTISTTTLEANSASSYGGGIYNTSATCSIDSSTLSSNTAFRAGGSYNTSSTLNVSNSTISSNSASENGGAIFSEYSPSNISNSTIASNAASAGSAAVVNRYNASVCTLVSSIAADNYPVDISNIDSGITTGDYSLIEDPNGHSVTDGGTNIVGQDPMLFPLGDYGGPTMTHSLMDGSPCIASGSNIFDFSNDQRGGGFPREDGTVDMGAVEYMTNTTLSVGTGGNGSGSITSSPAGIDCGASCSNEYDPNTTVILTAAPGTESFFTGWSGDCTGSGTCTVSMDQVRSVTANFTLNQYELNVAVEGTGTGTVSSSPAGISCGTDCLESYNYNTSVELFASPATGSAFSSWSGDCSGNTTCNITLDRARSVAASFTLNQYTVQADANGNGFGTVVSDVGGIDYAYQDQSTGSTFGLDHGSTLTLTATADTGSSVTWSGCAATGGTATAATCIFSSLDGDKTVTATFTRNQYTVQANATGNGSGTVSSDIGGINYSYQLISSGTTSSLNHGSDIILTATAEVGTNVAWIGCDSTGGTATEASCTLSSIDANKAVTASFILDIYPLSVILQGKGTGIVVSSPSGIDCGTDCDETYDYGTQVILTAAPQGKNKFTGWSGDCAGTEATCVITVDRPLSVGAGFDNSFPWTMFLPALMNTGGK